MLWFLTVLASLIWVPIGVWIGLRHDWPNVSSHWRCSCRRFPPTCCFPVVVSFIVVHRLNPEIWLSPLMILGTQWYILFNVIARGRRPAQ